MAVDVGSAVGYLDLDISGFLNNLRSAQQEADSASKDIISKFGSKVTNAGKAMTSAGTALTKSVTVPIVGAGTAVVTLSANFESAMSKVSAISGATGDDLVALNAKAQEMGAKTKFSASEAAEAFQYMAMAGWKTEDMLAGIDGIMNLAAADGLDLATTSDIVTDALTAFGLGAEDSAHFADVLAKASSSANTNVAMLGESFKYVAPVAGSLGYSAEDTAIALGLMANAGIKASQGGTALRGALTRMVKPTDDVAKLMKKYGISLTNSDGSMKSLGEVMTTLRTKLGGLSQAQQAQVAATLFGQEAMSGMLAIINASDDDFANLTEQIYDADGAAEQMANTMLDNLSGQITILKSALEGLALQFGEILLPHVKNFVTWIQNLVQKLQELTPEQKQQIVRWAAFAAAIGPVLVVVGKITTGVGGLITAFGKLKGGFSAVAAGGKAGAGVMAKLGGALAGITAPMIAVAAIVGVLIAAFTSLWKNNEEFRNKVIEIWNQVKETFNAFTQGIVERLNSLGFNFSSITEVLKSIWQGFCDFLAPIFIGVFQYISDTFKFILDIILGTVDFFINIFKGNWQGAWDAIKGIFESVWNYMIAWLSNVGSMLLNVLNVICGWFGTTWSAAWESIKTFFINTWNGISTGLQTALTGIWTFFQTVWNSISTYLTSTWNTIYTTVSSVATSVWSTITSIFGSIRDTISSIWNTIKTVISTVWNAIKTSITTAINNVRTTVAGVFNGIKSTVSTVWDGIKTKISTVWTNIKSSVTSAINNVRTTVAGVFNGVKSTVNTIWDGIKTKISSVWDGIKSGVSTAVNNVRTTVAGAFNGVKSTVSSVWESIKKTISDKITSAKDTVSSMIDKIKGVFNFSWSLPKLSLPHISVTGGVAPYGIGGKGSLPKFSIEWYKKAMNNGMILDSATIFGFDSNTGKFLGGGEAGSETIVGTKSLLSMIKQAVRDAIGPLVLASRELAKASAELGYVTYNGFVKLKEHKERQAAMSRNGDGNGDTFVFYSPKAIDEIEAAKQMKKTKRELAEGF